MPEDGVTNTSELDRIGTCFSSLTLASNQRCPTNMKSRMNSYNDEESDSNSDDSRSFCQSSRKGSADSDNADEFQRPILRQAISLESDASEINAEVESDSESEVDSNGNEFNNLTDLIDKLNNLEVTADAHAESQQGVDSNKKPKKNEHTGNEKSSSSTKEETTSDSNSDSEDDDEFITRGPSKYVRGKPYDRKPQESSSTDLQQLAPSDIALVLSLIDDNPHLIDDLGQCNFTEMPPNVKYAPPRSTTYPTISIVDTDPNPMSPPMQKWRLVRSPLSSASSSNTSDYNERSPQSDVNDFDSLNGDFVGEGFEQLKCHSDFLSPAVSPDISDISAQQKVDFELPRNINLNNEYGEYGGVQMFRIQDLNETTFNENQHQLINIISAIESEKTNYTTFENNGINIPSMQENLNVNNYDCSKQQTETRQYQLSPGNVTPSVQNGIRYSPAFDNTLQFEPATTIIQSSTPSTTIITTSHFPARGTVTVTSGFDSKPVNGNERNTILAQTYEGDQTWSSTSSGNESSFSSYVGTTPQSISASPVQIPEPVERLERPTAPPEWTLNPGALLKLKSKSASIRLKERVSEADALEAMCRMYPYPIDALTEVDDESKNTPLMTFVSSPKYLEKYPARLGAVLAKMEDQRPESLVTRNTHNHDALYLAAINSPNHDFVTAILADTIMKSHGGDHEIWRRTYNSWNDTLLHVVAAQGDNYVNILRELLAVKTPEDHCPFKLSAQNKEGKTPLHVAVESYDEVNGINTVNIIRMLMEYGADPTIKEYRNGDTALHVAISRKCCIGIIQALLCNTGYQVTNICNSMGNTALHLACDVLNNTDADTQFEVCYRLIVASSKSNVCNKRNELALSLVKFDRQPRLRELFHKYS